MEKSWNCVFEFLWESWLAILCNVSAVILMEGGTEEDLAILEEPEQDDGQRSRTTSETVDRT